MYILAYLIWSFKMSLYLKQVLMISTTISMHILHIQTAKGSGVPSNFVWGGDVQQIQLRTEDRENGDLGALAP
jgi:hypothetical protein